MGVDVRGGDKFILNTWGVNGTEQIVAMVNYTNRKGERKDFIIGPVTVTSDRTRKGDSTKIPEDGVVTSASTKDISGTIPDEPQEVYADVEITRGKARFAILLGGSVYGGHEPSYPGKYRSSLEEPARRVTNDGPSTLVNNVALTRTITVPTNTRWELLYGSVFNADNVLRNIRYRWDDGTNEIGGWTNNNNLPGAPASGRLNLPGYPGTADDYIGLPSKIPLHAGDRIQITFAAGGASAGGTARSSAVVMERLVHA